MTIICGNCLDILPTLPAESVQCVVTSPPYWGLRDYGTAEWVGGDAECDHNPQKPDGGARADRALPLGRGGMYRDVCGKCGATRVDSQLGLENTPEEYVAALVNVFREVRRVLRDDGVVFLNLGDSYAGSNCGSNDHRDNGASLSKNDAKYQGQKPSLPIGFKPKGLMGIPWCVAFALQAGGWYLRQDIIWAKPNPMPESVTDRCTKSHEYLFLLTKNAQYYYDADAIKEPANVATQRSKSVKATQAVGNTSAGDRRINYEKKRHVVTVRNKRDVWFIATKPFKGAHFATFPPALVEPCILAGSKPGDVVLDPFSGAGTVGVVAKQYGRNYIGIELNPEYNEIARARIDSVNNDKVIYMKDAQCIN